MIATAVSPDRTKYDHRPIPVRGGGPEPFYKVRQRIYNEGMHGEGPNPGQVDEDSALKMRQELSFLFDKDGGIAYHPELFSDEFSRFYGAYQRAAAREEGLRAVNEGKTVDYTQADYARRDAHIAAADQMIEDFSAKGIKLSSYEAETIIKKMLEGTNPGDSELPLLRSAFLQDVLERSGDDDF